VQIARVPSETKSKGLMPPGRAKPEILAFNEKGRFEENARPRRKVRFDRREGNSHLWFFGDGQAILHGRIPFISSEC